ncbi:MAG TPA: tRNA pseudouridine(55) synthase, partial [Terriglobales bacterium]|nr:tRNA pseudouridine(55) synthase [Terriglobales bacterium]
GPIREARPSLDEVRAAAAKFLGPIEQMPPPFSAKKIAGVPAYKLARKKKEVPLQPVKVEIRELEILGGDGDRARFRARVAPGTYLRSVAHDLGQALGVGAHLSALRRTRVAEFGLEEARTLEQVQEAVAAGTLEQIWVHPRKLLPELPAVTATEEALARICHGAAVNLPEMSKARLVKVFHGQAELIAIASRVAGTLFQPKVVLAVSGGRDTAY